MTREFALLPSEESYIGDQLRGFLRFRGLTIRAFSDSTGIPYRTLQDYLANKNRPGTAHMLAMARAGVDLNWLLLGSEDSRPAFSATTLNDWGLPSSSPLRGDRAFLAEMNRRIMIVVDDTNSAHVKRFGCSKSMHDMLLDYSKIWSLAARTIEEMAQSLEDLSSRGVPAETIADIVCHSLSKYMGSQLDADSQPASGDTGDA